MLLILDVDNAPSVLATTDRLAVDDNVALGANDSERNHVLQWEVRDALAQLSSNYTYPDTLVELDLLIVVLLGIEGVETDVMVEKLSTNLSCDTIN